MCTVDQSWTSWDYYLSETDSPATPDSLFNEVCILHVVCVYYMCVYTVCTCVCILHVVCVYMCV